jgi:hypothetical protein
MTMAFDLIDAKDITTDKLLELFKAAYIKASRIDDGDDDIRLEVTDNVLWLLRPHADRLKLFDYQQGLIISGCEDQIIKKVNEINETYAFCKLTVDFAERDTSNFHTFITYEFRFTQGLNFAQLIDDIHFFNRVKESAFNDLRVFLIEEKLLDNADKVLM